MDSCNELDQSNLPRQSQSPSYSHKRIGTNFPGLGSAIPSSAWFDIRVFYVRVSCCSLEEAPESLTTRFPPRSVDTGLEVNGSRVFPSEKAVLTLRRDRVDTQSAEATYVSTDNLRTTGRLPFEVFEMDELLLCGSIDRSEVMSDGQGIDRLDSVGILMKNCKIEWSMECQCAICSPGCAFLKGRGKFATTNFSSPSMEVYVAGRCSGSPVILTHTVQLLLKRRHSREGTLGAIPEVDESERSNNSLLFADLASQIEEHRVYEEMENRNASGLDRYYDPDSGGYMQGDDGELTWFNAGVRVGVGIGLGMCLGIGIGVGLLVRTYQATTRTFRRRFF